VEVLDQKMSVFFLYKKTYGTWNSLSSRFYTLVLHFHLIMNHEPRKHYRCKKRIIKCFQMKINLHWRRRGAAKTGMPTSGEKIVSWIYFKHIYSCHICAKCAQTETIIKKESHTYYPYKIPIHIFLVLRVIHCRRGREMGGALSGTKGNGPKRSGLGQDLTSVAEKWEVGSQRRKEMKPRTRLSRRGERRGRRSALWDEKRCFDDVLTREVGDRLWFRVPESEIRIDLSFKLFCCGKTPAFIKDALRDTSIIFSR
jgi:hypothetical protein